MEGVIKQRERPKSVILFEVMGIMVTVAHLALTEEAIALVWVVLTLWVTRGRSRIARVIYTALLSLGTAAVATAYAKGTPATDALTVVLLALILVMELTLLWSSSTSTWLKPDERA